MEHGARGDHIALVQQQLGQHLGIHTGIHPPEHASRLGHKTATCGLCQRHAARARLGQMLTQPLGMAAQLALFHAQGQGLLHGGRRGQGGEQLGVQQPLDQLRWRRHIAQAPIGHQHLAKPLM